MIDDGALTGVDQVLGIHPWAPLQVRQVGRQEGAIFGSADGFGITVRPVAAATEAYAPHQHRSVVAAARVVLALQGIVDRPETSPFSCGGGHHRPGRGRPRLQHHR